MGKYLRLCNSNWNLLGTWYSNSNGYKNQPTCTAVTSCPEYVEYTIVAISSHTNRHVVL